MAGKEAAGPARAVHLLDANILVALVSPSHVHHGPAHAWFAEDQAPFVTCPFTQSTLLRILMHLGGLDGLAAMAVLRQLLAQPRHVFWPGAIGYADVGWQGVLGQRQVTDACLAGLARHHRGRLLTLDRGLAALHADVAVLLPAG